MTTEMDQSLVNFYKGAEIFLTGGTGFIGKGIAEKLLRSFDVKCIYLLIRSQKTHSPAERLDKLKNDVIFDVLRKENPDALNKLIFVPGDMSEIGLGITSESRQQMSNVSIVIHSAATIRFDEPMKKAILLNVRGVREILELSINSFQNLKSFLHISTMYSNPFLDNVEEKIYSPQMDWRTAISLSESQSSEFLSSLTPKLITSFPNTYTFTKHLSEQIINEYRSRVPVAIVRPSIVISTCQDPFPSYVDNVVAVNGFAAGVGVGNSRLLHAHPETKLDCVPLDLVVKSTILTAWHATEQAKHKTDSVFISNCCLPGHTDTLKVLTNVLVKTFQKFPADIMVWRPGVQIIESNLYFLFMFFFVQILPALVIHTGLCLVGRKSMLMKAQRFIFASSQTVHFFASRSFQFQNKNLMNLEEIATKINSVRFCKIADLDTNLMAECIVLSCRRHIYKMVDESIPRAKNLYKMLVCFEYCLKAMIAYVIVKLCLRLFVTSYF